MSATRGLLEWLTTLWVFYFLTGFLAFYAGLGVAVLEIAGGVSPSSDYLEVCAVVYVTSIFALRHEYEAGRMDVAPFRDLYVAVVDKRVSDKVLDENQSND